MPELNVMLILAGAVLLSILLLVALLVQRMKWKKAIMNLPIPLCILEFDGNISWFNEKFYEMTQSPDLLGENIDNIVKNLNLRKVLNENKEMYTDVTYKGRDYTVVYNVIKNEQNF